MPYEFVKDLAHLRKALPPTGTRMLPGAADDILSFVHDLYGTGAFAFRQRQEVSVTGPATNTIAHSEVPADFIRIYFAIGAFHNNGAGMAITFFHNVRTQSGGGATAVAIKDRVSLNANQHLAVGRSILVPPFCTISAFVDPDLPAAQSLFLRVGWIELPIGEYVIMP